MLGRQVTMMTLTEEMVWEALQEVKDPEIPVISLVEMGIVREVVCTGEAIKVKMIPTFSGCPALVEMERLIEERLLALGAAAVEVEVLLKPAWSSDWITDEGRAKLKAFGLQPPHKHGGNIVQTFFEPVTCPRCDSPQTTLKNSFGSTLCRSIWVCDNCLEPFEQFKAL